MRSTSSSTLTERLAFGGVRVFAFAVLTFLVAPIFVVFPLSFTAGQLLVFPLPGWSLQWYREFFTSPLWTGALLNSLFVGIVTTIVATVLGTMAALGLHGARFRLKPFIMALLVTPIAVPVVIIAVSAFYFFAAVNLVGTYIGLILAHVALALPFVVITARVSILSSIPGGDRCPPIPRLRELGVDVFFGSDNIRDCWNPSSVIGMIDRSMLATYRFGLRRDQDIEALIDHVTTIPARVAGLGSGAISEGARADLIAFDAVRLSQVIVERQVPRMVIAHGVIIHR